MKKRHMIDGDIGGVRYQARYAITDEGRSSCSLHMAMDMAGIDHAVTEWGFGDNDNEALDDACNNLRTRLAK